MMRFYTKPHQFYCGIDLHARLLAICALCIPLLLVNKSLQKGVNPGSLLRRHRSASKL